jgi:hypothetical protein
MDQQQPVAREMRDHPNRPAEAPLIQETACRTVATAALTSPPPRSGIGTLIGEADRLSSRGGDRAIASNSARGRRKHVLVAANRVLAGRNRRSTATEGQS